MRQFNATNSDDIISKTKNFSGFFLAFLKSTLNFEHFQKKMTFIADLFPKLRTPKNVLDICPKSPDSKDPLTGNIVNGFKHCWNLNHSTVTIFSDHVEGN